MIRPELDFYAPPVNFNAVNVERRNKQRTNIYAWRAAATAADNTQNNSNNNNSSSSSSSYYTSNNLHRARGTYNMSPSHTSLTRHNATSIERFMPGSTRAAEKEHQHELEVNGHWPRGAVMMPDRRRQWKMSGFDFTQTEKSLPSSSFFHKSQSALTGSTKMGKTLPRHGKYKNQNTQDKNKTHGSSNKDKFVMNNTYFHDTITFYKPSSSSLSLSLTDTHMDAEVQENETSHLLPLLSRMRQEHSSSENKTNKLNASSTSTLLALTCNSAELQAMCLNGTLANNKCTNTKADNNNDDKRVDENNNKSNENNCKNTLSKCKQEEFNVKQKLVNDRQWVRRLGPVLETKYECNQVADEFCKTLNYTTADSTEMFEKIEINDENSKLEKTAGETKHAHKAAPISLPTAELAYTLRPKYAHEHSHIHKANLEKQETQQEQEEVQEGYESRQNAYLANTYDGTVKDTSQFMLSGRNWNRTMYNNYNNNNNAIVDNSDVNRNNSTRQIKRNENELAQGHLQMNKRNNVSSSINNNSTMYLRSLHLLPTEAKLMRLYAVNVPTAMQSSDLSMVRRQEPPRLGVKISL